jgi:hypothetical protein
MAVVVGPLHSTEARGKVGGIVYNTWRGRSTVRTKVTPANQYTPRRLDIRAKTKACTLRWQEITDNQRAAWCWWAAIHPDIDWTGKPKRLTGYNWWVRCNCRLLDIGLDIIDTPPLRSNQWPVATLDTTTDEDQVVVTWSLPAGAPDTDLIVDIWLTTRMSPGRKPKIEDAKHYAYVPAEDGTYTTGSLQAGHYGVYARVIDETTGLASPWILSEITIPSGGAASQGPYTPDSGQTLNTNLNIWANPDRITAIDDSTAHSIIPESESSDDLLGTDYDFAIPVGATITGILVEVRIRVDDDGTLNGTLYREGSPVGDTKQSAITPNGLSWYSLGGAADLWGTTWTPAQINAAGFGAICNVANDGSEENDAYVDAYRVTVHYTT